MCIGCTLPQVILSASRGRGRGLVGRVTTRGTKMTRLTALLTSMLLVAACGGGSAASPAGPGATSAPAGATSAPAGATSTPAGATSAPAGGTPAAPPPAGGSATDISLLLS